MITKLLLAAFLAVLGLAATQQDDWLRLVAPVISTAERTRYQSLSVEARQNFQEHFWEDKSVTLAEFSQRLDYIDTTFGSGRRGSGINTDQGRVYLSLGAPYRITHLPSSRTFVPLEIWYYNTAPSAGVSSELRLVFYEKNGVGIPKLYSPNIDTIRELLLPQAGTVGMFGPNDTLDLTAIQSQLTTRPVENEVIEAATGVSPGIRNEENDTVLLRAMSPQIALSQRALKTRVTSRILAHRQDLDIVQTVSPYGGTQVDLRWKANVSRKLKLEVADADGLLYTSELNTNFDRKQSISYLHRLDLLPGRYTVTLAADGIISPYPLQIANHPVAGEILRATEQPSANNIRKPFEWNGRQFQPSSDGAFALLPVPHRTAVNWIIRQGQTTLWKKQTEGDLVSIVDLPLSSLRPGAYKLEAATAEGELRTVPLEINNDAGLEPSVSYNANLAEGDRLRFLGHQWLRRGQPESARALLTRSLQEVGSNNAGTLIELSRLDASTGHFDEARERLRPLLNAQQHNFEALATMAYIEAGLQDWPTAARFYRQALAVQDSPVLRQALAGLPGQ